MKTNLIFIIVDTLRADALRAMPKVKKLAHQGVFFSQAYAGITKTDPSISSIFSGRYPLSIGLISHGQWITQKEEENIKKVKLLPEILQENGYQTLAVDWLSRWHARGYDHYSGKILADSESESLIKDKFFYLKYFRKIDRLLLIRFLQRDFLTRLAFSSLMKNPVPYDPANVVVNKAIEYLENYSEKKFFLYLHFWDNHWPYIKPRHWQSLLFDTVKDRYLTEARFIDNQLGRLFHYLKQKKLFKKTLIIFTSDHGESLDEHGLFTAHQGLYEQVIKVPLIFHGPRLPKKNIESLVAHVDIFPTILDYLGISLPRNLDGYSLLPLIKGKKNQVRDFVFFLDVVFGQMKIKKAKRRRGIRMGDYKYLQYLKVDDKSISRIFLGPEIEVINEELFNLKKDPQEKNNLADVEVSKKEQLKKALMTHLQALKKKRKK